MERTFDIHSLHERTISGRNLTRNPNRKS